MPAVAAIGPFEALALASTAEPAVPATLVLMGEEPGTLASAAIDGAGDDLALLALDSPALSLRLTLEPWELVVGIDGRPDEAARAAWRATFGTEAPTAWRGGVPGREDAWARLLEVDGAWSGHVSANGTLWRIDPVRRTAGVEHAVRRVAGIGAGVAGTGRTETVLRIGIVVDSRFDERHDGHGLERALAVVNGVDGLYRHTLGIGLAVDAVRLHLDPATDPLRDGDTVEGTLDAFRSLREADPELPSDLALVHLFTGLDDVRGAVGLGYVDGVCRDAGWATSLSTPFAFDMLLAAHEMAHVVGVAHDDDPSCTGLATEADLMWPTLSGISRATFSSCSVQAVRRTLDSGCLIDGRVALVR